MTIPRILHIPSGSYTTDTVWPSLTYRSVLCYKNSNRFSISTMPPETFTDRSDIEVYAYNEEHLEGIVIDDEWM